MESASFREHTSGEETRELKSAESDLQAQTNNQQDSKIQSAWDTVKNNLSRRPSFTKAWRRWSRSSNDELPAEDHTRKSQDEENSLFCDALLGLMRRTGRYDYTGYNVKKESESSDIKADKPERKRVSWSK
ncbi:MAG: hypothetical protein Q9217_004669 [Psora testacea]